jgi:hypothetical protein
MALIFRVGKDACRETRKSLKRDGFRQTAEPAAHPATAFAELSCEPRAPAKLPSADCRRLIKRGPLEGDVFINQSICGEADVYRRTVILQFFDGAPLRAPRPRSLCSGCRRHAGTDVRGAHTPIATRTGCVPERGRSLRRTEPQVRPVTSGDLVRACEAIRALVLRRRALRALFRTRSEIASGRGLGLLQAPVRGR